MKALSVFADMIAFSGQEAQVSTKIWVDVNDLAALIDGDNSVEYLTLGAAVVARDNLPADRIDGAKINAAHKSSPLMRLIVFTTGPLLGIDELR